MESNKAVVLFSGGLDSATCLASAIDKGYNCTAFTINYNQRHSYEVTCSKKYLIDYPEIKHVIFDLDLKQIGGSALTDLEIKVPSMPTEGIPITYVPARNTIFLSLAASYAEKNNIRDIFIGVNSIDYSGYPDCRPEYISAIQTAINLGTKLGIEGKKINIHTPLIKMSKIEIVKLGTKLGINYSKTLSCYKPDSKGHACGVCDSCRFRKEGFRGAKISDPTKYIE